MKIAIIGSRNYTNRKNIQNFMFRLKMEHKGVEVVSGGAKDGADKYGKPYNVGYYHKRNKDLVKYSDKVVAFIKDDIITNGTKSALEYCKKINKKFVILS